MIKSTSTTKVPGSKMSQPVSHFLNKRWLNIFVQNRLAVVGLLIILLFFAVCLFAPILTPPSGKCLAALGGAEGARLSIGQLGRAIFLAPEPCYVMPRSGLAFKPSPPTRLNPMGTVDGYDIFYGLVWGARSSLGFGVLIVFCSVLIGTLIGLISGYTGGWLDSLLMRFTDLVYASPSLVVSIVLVAVLGHGLFNVGLSFIIVTWTLYARVVRAETLKVRNLEYVEASRALGNNPLRVMVRHVLPNVSKPILTIMVLQLGTVPLQLSALSFLGIGTPSGHADWGRLVGLAYPWIPGVPGNPFIYWYVLVFPGLTILLYSLGWNLFGDVLQDALDVKTK